MCFYDWKSAWSGPGQTLIRSYGQEKSKFCVVECMDKVIANSILIKMLTPQKIDYLMGPTTENNRFVFGSTWNIYAIPRDTQFTLNPSIWTTKEEDEDRGYPFRVSVDRFEMLLSGTFVIAQSALLDFLPNILLCEIGSYVF